MDYVCKVCGNQTDNRIYQVRERRINKGESFQYIQCKNCGTLALNEKIDNMYDYYTDSYYSFHINIKHRSWLIRRIRKILLRGIIAGAFPRQLCLNILNRRMVYMRCLYNSKIKLNAKVLDVGGGVGAWLMRLQDIGYTDLTNMDLYAEPPAEHNGIKYIKSDLLHTSLQEQYDLITMHHSFEHMDHPDAVLKNCYKLLKEDGLFIIRIPVMGKQAWKEYGVNWYQIDAPRHLFLYTEKALAMLLKRNGFYICNIVWDSAADQMKKSAMYRDTNLSFQDFHKKDLNKKDYKMAKKLNSIGEGDQACFYIRKASGKWI